MLSAGRRSTRAALAIAAALAFASAVAALMIPSQSAGAANIGALQRQVNANQSKVSALSGVVSAYSSRLARLDASISTLQARIARIQTDLNMKRMELFRLQVELTAARNRLRRLEAFEARGESLLARQLVNSYESDRPDLVTVVLESTGFQDMLERLSFAQRVQRQNVRIVKEVRAARRAVAAQAVKLGALEVRQQALTNQVLAERNALAGTTMTLLRQRIAVATARGVKAGQLAHARAQLAGVQNQLSQAQAAIAARSTASDQGQPGSSSGAPPPGPVSSSGGFVFPLPKGSASPPGSWSEDQGVDISAPGGTPEYAVCSGTIVLHGIGGFGPWAPVLHCDSPIDGYSYVYYGHAGPAYQLGVGTHVGAGQVMSSIGPGIVGISTGPHLEIGFADSSGSPIGGGSAGTMMSLLRGSY
jgi:murein DD-endopeptidase MepM/ murein hydrolase activator NlpD